MNVVGMYELHHYLKTVGSRDARIYFRGNFCQAVEDVKLKKEKSGRLVPEATWHICDEMMRERNHPLDLMKKLTELSCLESDRGGIPLWWGTKGKVFWFDLEPSPSPEEKENTTAERKTTVLARKNTTRANEKATLAIMENRIHVQEKEEICTPLMREDTDTTDTVSVSSADTDFGDPSSRKCYEISVMEEDSDMGEDGQYQKTGL
ncbi:hypothetical protein QBC32DRAFT_336379 [Pseudoneurospora amorphoporcata]|uniref:Uncharacterized protein n=1 Tax=Pseudoneurospora amorphoporcata TaxID=241081 RepID=A0AAN6SHE5_9PEZI|nr:hypothetical protein QBC32DRAFT_336379 [Pseudoneurospora amorphoporcata]